MEPLRRALIQGADLQKLEKDLQVLEDRLLNADAGKKTVGSASDRKKSLPASQETVSTEELLSLIREVFLYLLEEFGTSLSHDYLILTGELRKRVWECHNLDCFLSLKQEITALLNSYANQIFHEREQAASFVVEVGQRLDEIESHLLASMRAADDSQSASQIFTLKMAEEIDEVSASVRNNQQLEDLRGHVLAKLDSFKDAIQEKHRQDEARQQSTTWELNKLRKTFQDFRNEARRVHRERQHLQRKLSIDPLTQTYNRRAYEEHLTREIDRFRRYQQTFSVIIFDLDHFKGVNDTYGHLAGDKCLKEIVGLVKPLLRKSDFLARYGGDEFVLLLPETGQDQALKTAEKLRREVERSEFHYRGRKVPVTISLGVTQVKSDDENSTTLLDRADQALLKAKRSGRNKVVIA
jgi:diguanylate cyclase (GGDEF)-like protein